MKILNKKHIRWAVIALITALTILGLYHLQNAGSLSSSIINYESAYQ